MRRLVAGAVVALISGCSFQCGTPTLRTYTAGTSSDSKGPVIGVEGPHRWRVDGKPVDVANTHTLMFPAQKTAIFVVDVTCGPQFPCPTDFAQFTNERAAEMALPLLRYVAAHGLHRRQRLAGVSLGYVGVAFSQPVPDSNLVDAYRYKLSVEELEAMTDGGT